MGAMQSINDEQSACGGQVCTATAQHPYIHNSDARSPARVPVLSPVCGSGLILQSSLQQHSSSIRFQQNANSESPAGNTMALYRSPADAEQHQQHQQYLNRKLTFTTTSSVTEYSDIPVRIDETTSIGGSGSTSRRDPRPIETVLVYSTLSTSSLADTIRPANSSATTIMANRPQYLPPFPNSSTNTQSKSDIELFLEIKVPRSEAVSAAIYGNYTDYTVQY
eukprot:Lankesteria_metandrocarpae@DN5550_c0_g1_i1.p1